MTLLRSEKMGILTLKSRFLRGGFCPLYYFTHFFRYDFRNQQVIVCQKPDPRDRRSTYDIITGIWNFEKLRAKNAPETQNIEFYGANSNP